MHALAITSLTKIYAGGWRGKGQTALAGVDLRLERGAAFGLIGPNGAGKTTLIKTLLGIVQPTSGSVEVLGGSPLDPEVRRRIGYLPERLELPTFLSARDVLASVARLKGVALSASSRDALLERVGLRDVGPKRTGSFSKGMRQRLGLATALIGEPDLLILDEPTDGIDPLGRVEIRTLLQQELRRGATLFLNSHLLAETERICSRFGILAAGKVVREGTLEDVKRSVRTWMVRFAPGCDSGALATSGLRATANPLEFVIDADSPEVLNAAVDRARASGALLVELRPRGDDLESLLAASIVSAEEVAA